MAYHLTPEKKLILFLSRVNPSPHTMKTAEHLLKESTHPIDFTALKDLADMNGVSSLLYQNVRTLNGVPEEIVDKLKNVYLCTMRTNIVKAKEILRIVSLLNAEGVNAMPLKGPIASDVIFGDPGLYPSSDIDILVRPSELEMTKEILLKIGYREIDEVLERDTLSARDSRYTLTFGNGTYVIEIHWNLVFRYFNIPPAFWWEDTGVLEYEVTKIPALSKERYLLYTLFRLYCHRFVPLKFLVLSAELINKYGKEIRWDQLLAFAEQYRMSRVVYFILKLLDELLGANIPEELADRKIFGYEFLKKVTLSGLFHRTTRIHLRMVPYTILQDTPLDMLRILVRRVFPTTGEIRLRYGLPPNSKRLFLYYFLNPLLLLLRRR